MGESESPGQRCRSRTGQIRLAARPVGLPTADNWQFTTEPVAEPEAGGVLVKTQALSLDPAMRGWMNEGKSYIPPVGIGEVMRALGIGKGVVLVFPHAGNATRNDRHVAWIENAVVCSSPSSRATNTAVSGSS